MLSKAIKYSAILLASMTLVASCSKEENEPMEDRQESSESSEWEVSAPIRFSDGDDLRAALAGYSESGGVRSRAADDGFVSYLETVMEEPGYDDQPYAILSGAFGAILNSEGEVVFGDNLIHVSRHGILYGPVSESETIRDVAGRFDLLSLCAEQGYYAPADRDDFYKVNGYEGIYLYDTFGFVSGDEDGSVLTRSGLPVPNKDCKYNDMNETSVSLGFRPNSSAMGGIWDKEFTRPQSGDQKVKFSDGKHCNDTKIYHQDYGIATDTGLKSKTMKKCALGYWDKIDGDMEGGIVLLAVYEYISQDDNTSKFVNGVSNISYGGKKFTIFTAGAKYASVNSVMEAFLDLKINVKGIIDNVKAETGEDVDAIRYPINSKVAVTLFPDKIKKGTMSKIEMSFVVPFGGNFIGDWCTGSFHVLHEDIYGLTIRGNEIRGSVLRYRY